MIRGISGRMDLNVTHELSGRKSIGFFENIKNFENDLKINTKIELLNNNIKGVH